MSTNSTDSYEAKFLARTWNPPSKIRRECDMKKIEILEIVPACLPSLSRALQIKNADGTHGRSVQLLRRQVFVLSLRQFYGTSRMDSKKKPTASCMQSRNWKPASYILLYIAATQLNPTSKGATKQEQREGPRSSSVDST